MFPEKYSKITPWLIQSKKALSKRVLDTLKKMQKDQLKTIKNFEGICPGNQRGSRAEDYENSESIAELFLFASTVSEENKVNTTFDQYIERMNSNEEKIYYSIVDTYEAAANSPHIEHLKANGTEVLLLTDRIDEWLMSTLMAL